MPRDVGVILVAAGQGTRLGTGADSLPKQFRPLAGIPLLLRALRPFASHPDVGQIVVALPSASVDAPPAWLQEVAGDRLILTAGGNERSDSVAAALARLHASHTLVLVHDAARPLVSREVIDRVIAGVRAGTAVVPVVPVRDTLKESAGSPEQLASVQRTVPRDRLWRAQTPQGFARAVLERAHREGRGTPGETPSDDALMVERLGLPVLMVAGDERNLKITTEADWDVAEALLAAGGAPAGRHGPSFPLR